MIESEIKVQPEILFKIVIVGDSGVGKSCLLLRYADDYFDSDLKQTIGVDFKIKTIHDNGRIIKLQIWDTAGSERFRSITSSYYRGAQAVIIVYDVTNPQSKAHVEKWKQDVLYAGAEEHSIWIVGNKNDKDCKERSANACKERTASAKTGHGVNQLFDEIVSYLQREHDDSIQKIIGNAHKTYTIHALPVALTKRLTVIDYC